MAFRKLKNSYIRESFTEDIIQWQICGGKKGPVSDSNDQTRLVWFQRKWSVVTQKQFLALEILKMLVIRRYRVPEKDHFILALILVLSSLAFPPETEEACNFFLSSIKAYKLTQHCPFQTHVSQQKKKILDVFPSPSQMYNTLVLTKALLFKENVLQGSMYLQLFLMQYIFDASPYVFLQFIFLCFFS